MNLMELYRNVITLFKNYWSVSFYIGSYRVTIGSAILFVLVAGLVVKLIKGIVY